MKIHPLRVAACLGFALLFSHGEPASACKCVQPLPPSRQELKKATAVFAGKVEEVRVQRTAQGYRERRVKLTVSRVWKGISSKTVVVTTGFGGGDCGVPFVKGGEFLVYAYALTGQKSLYTNVCTRTARLSQAQNDLKALGPGRAP